MKFASLLPGKTGARSLEEKRRSDGLWRESYGGAMRFRRRRVAIGYLAGQLSTAYKYRGLRIKTTGHHHN
jgi:hypothetical protein